MKLPFSCHFYTFLCSTDSLGVWMHSLIQSLGKNHIVEGEQGWVLQGVLSRAIFRRAAARGQTVFTVLSLHISNINAKKKGIGRNLILTLRAIMISQEGDLVAGDFNGTAWRFRSRDNISTIEEAFSDCALPTPQGLPPRWGPGSIPNLGRRLWISQTTWLSTILES